MVAEKILDHFFEAIHKDPIIDAGHIALFMALYRKWKDAGQAESIAIERFDIMYLAKIGSTTTYFRKMQDLNEQGYIVYEPSRKNGKKSCVKMKNVKNGEQQSNNVSGSS